MRIHTGEPGHRERRARTLSRDADIVLGEDLKIAGIYASFASIKPPSPPRTSKENDPSSAPDCAAEGPHEMNRRRAPMLAAPL